MPLTLPQLDDRSWQDLVEESRSLIPHFAPEWTNHNPSDPGITLVELFAYLTEILLYRVNRISESSLRAFLKLVNSPGWQPGTDLVDDIRKTISGLRTCSRAITAHDFESLALGVNDELGPDAPERVARAHCLPRRNLEGGGGVDTPGHVTVVVVASGSARPSDRLLKRVRNRLEPARMITTRVHVVAPRLVTVSVRITLVIERGMVAQDVRESAVQALKKFFDPLEGGSDGRGWPFGRDVYVSEVYQVLAALPGVLSVRRTQQEHTLKPADEVTVGPGDTARLKYNRLGEIEAIDLKDDELVNLQLDPNNIAVTYGGL